LQVLSYKFDSFTSKWEQMIDVVYKLLTNI
jgi:hypothetical protein